MTSEGGPIAPLLSVTVLNYNYGRYLGECLDSILSQTFKDFEVIVIDDCSSDDSVAVVTPYLQDSRVRLIPHERNVGFAGSLMEATEVHSRGELLMVVSADDVVRRNDAFERQVNLMEASDNSAFCFAAYTSRSEAVEDLYQPFATDADSRLTRRCVCSSTGVGRCTRARCIAGRHTKPQVAIDVT